MKKITLAFILLAGVLGVFSAHNKAEALSMIPSKLLFQDITQTGMTVRYNPAGSYNNPDLANAITNKSAVYLNYRPTMCGDDPATSPYVACPAIYMIPTTVSFGYSPNTIPTLLPAYLTNLKSDTKYTFWISYDNSIRCITTPCPSTTDDFSNRALTSTLPSSQVTGQTQLKFSNITNSTATISVLIGNDKYQQWVEKRADINIQYLQDSWIDYEMRTFPYSSDTYNPLPVTLTGLQPNTTYRVWLGYNPNPKYVCTTSVPCPITGIRPFWETEASTFTTTGGGVAHGQLTQKLYLGIKSPEVAILQQFLIKEGYLTGSTDGLFGPMTHSAVRRFQTALGLLVDGRVGPNTRSLINKLIVQ